MKKKYKILLGILIVSFFILFSFYLLLRFTPEDQAINFDNLTFSIINYERL